MQEQVVDKDTTLVLDDEGNLKYTRIGADDNLPEGEGWRKADRTLVDAETEDLCDYKSADTRYKIGVAADGWQLGIKDGATQYLTSPFGIYGSDDGDNWIEIERTVAPTLGKQGNLTSFDGLFASGDCLIEVGTFGSGCATKHTFKQSLKDKGYKYIGVRWDYDDANILNVVQPVPGTQIVNKEGHFFEYFDVHFLEGGDWSHLFTTVGGNLTSDTVWGAGTYHMTSFINHVGYKLTQDAAAGPVIVKIDGGLAYSFYALNANNSKLVTANTETHRVTWTKAEDNTIGEVIGAPVAGSPQRGAVFYCSSGSTFTGMEIDLQGIDFKFIGTTGGSNSVVACWNASTNLSNVPMTIKRFTVKNCSAKDNGIFTDSGLGGSRYLGNTTIEDGVIDTSNTFGSGVYDCGIYITRIGDVNIKNVTVQKCGTNAYGAITVFRSHGSHESDNDINVHYCDLTGSGAATRQTLTVFDYESSVVTMNVRGGILQSPGSAGSNRLVYLNTAVGAPTINVVFEDVIFLDVDQVNDYAITQTASTGSINTTIRNCDFFNCTNKWNAGTPDGSNFEVDPGFANVAGGVTITNGQPDGRAVTEATLIKAGYDTYTNYGLDASTRIGTDSATADSPGDNVTVGLLYKVSGLGAAGGGGGAQISSGFMVPIFQPSFQPLFQSVMSQADGCFSAATWTGAVDNSWNNPGNWLGGAVPGPTSQVVFCSDYSVDCTIDVNASVASFVMQTGYTGTVTQQAGVSLDVSAGLIFMGGTFVGGTVDNIWADFLQDGGDVTMTSGITEMNAPDADFKHISGTFNANSGKLRINSVFHDMDFNGITLYDFEQNLSNINSSTNYLSSFTVANEFRITGGYVAGASGIEITVLGDLVSTRVDTGGFFQPLDFTWVIAGTGAQEIYANKALLRVTLGGCLRIDKPSGTVTLYDILVFAGQAPGVLLEYVQGTVAFAAGHIFVDNGYTGKVKWGSGPRYPHITLNKQNPNTIFELDQNLAVTTLTIVTGRIGIFTNTLDITHDFTFANDFGNVQGGTIIVGGNFNWTNGDLVPKPTAAWFLDITGTATADSVDVRWSDASAGTAVTATNSDDEGNNVNWNFV